MSRLLRSRSHVDYSSESLNDSVFTVLSASKWNRDTTRYMNIKVIDVNEMFATNTIGLPDEAKHIVIPEWTGENWLNNVNIRTSSYDNKIKTLIKIIIKSIII